MSETSPAEAPKRSALREFFNFIDFPWGVWFIIGNEFCERFSFYGMQNLQNLILCNIRFQGHFGTLRESIFGF